MLMSIMELSVARVIRGSERGIRKRLSNENCGKEKGQPCNVNDKYSQTNGECKTGKANATALP